MCAMVVPLFIVDQNPMNIIPSPKIEVLQVDPKPQNGDILKNYFIKFYEELFYISVQLPVACVIEV
jgi:hypothetical protein